jgi:hypothetical protein
MKAALEVDSFDENQDIAILPYHPRLSKVLGGATLALVVTYLEIHHRTPIDNSEASTGRSNGPVHVSCDAMCTALGVNRRTLMIALYNLCTWWRSDQERSAASRAGREFLNPNHSFRGKVKPYSIIGSKQYTTSQTLAFHRNPPRISQIIRQAGIPPIDQPTLELTNIIVLESAISATEGTAHILKEIMEKAMKIGVRNGWTDERRKRASEQKKAYHAAKREMREKSGCTNKPYYGNTLE